MLALLLMKLREYLSNPGAQAKLARVVGVTPVSVHHWSTGARQVPAARCPTIEKATGGTVRCEDLRPDIDWAYLRATDCGIQTVGAGEVAA